MDTLNDNAAWGPVAPLVWAEYIGAAPVLYAPALVAFYDSARDDALTFEVGYPEPTGGWTDARGNFIQGVWSYAPIVAR